MTSQHGDDDRPDPPSADERDPAEQYTDPAAGNLDPTHRTVASVERPGRDGNWSDEDLED